MHACFCSKFNLTLGAFVGFGFIMTLCIEIWLFWKFYICPETQLNYNSISLWQINCGKRKRKQKGETALAYIRIWKVFGMMEQNWWYLEFGNLFRMNGKRSIWFMVRILQTDINKSSQQLLLQQKLRTYHKLHICLSIILI